MSTKVAIGCVWAVGLFVLLAVLGSRSEETSIEIWMWTAGITALCWLIAKVIHDRASDNGLPCSTQAVIRQAVQVANKQSK